MIKTRHLLLILLTLLYSSLSWAQAPTMAISTDIERSELPLVMASIYDHWEKDLMPTEAVSTPLASGSETSNMSAWVPQVGFMLLLVAVGFRVVSDASRMTPVEKRSQHPEV